MQTIQVEIGKKKPRFVHFEEWATWLLGSGFWFIGSAPKKTTAQLPVTHTSRYTILTNFKISLLNLSKFPPPPTVSKPVFFLTRVESMLLRFPFSLFVLKYSNFQNILTGSHALLEGGALWGWWWCQVFTSGKSANPTVHC